MVHGLYRVDIYKVCVIRYEGHVLKTIKPWIPIQNYQSKLKERGAYPFLIATIESGSITLISWGGTTLELLQYFHRNGITWSIWIKLDQFGSNLINLDQTWLIWIKLDQFGSNLIKLDQTWLNLNKLDQTWSNWNTLDQTCSNLIKLDQTWSNWNKLD